ncbi:uncharacterized protein LOC116303205 [Actinia tenebrosa]|uniref:Uncharacterized protein LOC116303205 n=1 Tax=Actinia tenebrosa TaxID=6105 RepID=A0A6P8IQ42_ACTTE|nr:uncharacterized protein LOC116303205 [Actinia tenebrosa]
MLIYAVFLVLAIVTSAEVSEVVDDEGKHSCAESDWVKISRHAVCFEALGDHYGSFHNYVRGGIVAAIKLEYVSGMVNCVAAAGGKSHWGCNNDYFKTHPLAVVLTDNRNNMLFPKKEFITYPYGVWYWLPFVHPLDKELIFTDYATPIYFPLYKEMRIWYGEDLKDAWTGAEGDNTGRVCVNVYARFKL